MIKSLLIKLYICAKKSNRKRSHHLLHKSHHDKVQRLLIAMMKGSYVEPHYHEQPHQWELFQVLDGLVKVTLYCNGGSIDKSFEIEVLILILK